MPVFRWEDLPEHRITPKHSIGIGKTVSGDMIFVQRIVYNPGEDRGDGKAGAKLHHHPEEQMLIVVEGESKFFEGGKWYTIKAGDIVWIPAYSDHEAYSDVPCVIYQFKVRVPGHSTYDQTWQPGSQEAWEQHVNNFKELRKKYKEPVPWE